MITPYISNLIFKGGCKIIKNTGIILDVIKTP